MFRHYNKFKFEEYKFSRLELLSLPAPEDGGSGGGGGGGGGSTPVSSGGTGGGSTVISTSVSAKCMPWSTAANPGLPYGIGDGSGPVVISLANFNIGDKITITASGQVKPRDSWPWNDPNGNLNFKPTGSQKGSTGTYFPTKYMGAGCQLGLTALVGAFVDGGGVVIANTPLAIGSYVQTTIPTGAVSLQLGLNDDKFADNIGSFYVSIVVDSSVNQPDPNASNPLLFTSSGGLTGIDSSFILGMPVYDTKFKQNVVICPENNFNCEEDALYKFPREIVDPGKVITVRRVRLLLRNLGVVKFDVVLDGMFSSLTKTVEFGDPSKIIPGTMRKVRGLADNRLYTMYADLEFSDEQVQLQIARYADNGPLSIVGAMLLGEGQEMDT